MKKFSNLFNVISALCLVLATLAVLPAQPAYASTLTVNTLTDENDHSCVDGDCSFRDALEVATNSDSISFSVTGTITLASQLNVNKNLTITGPGSVDLTVSGNDATRIFRVFSGKTVSISGMTLTHGKPPVAAGLSCGGGAIYNDGYLTLDDMVVTNSDATLTDSSSCKYPRGGGILNWDFGSLTITNSTISNNMSYALGGGIFFQSTQGTISLTDVTIFGNSSAAYNGGGLAVAQTNGAVTLTRVSIHNNLAYYSGNGLMVDKNGNGAPTVSQVDIIDSYIYDNDRSDVDGAGVYLTEVPVINIKGSLITNNTGLHGGGLYIQNYANNSTVSIVNSTIAGNSGSAGGGLYLDSYNGFFPTVNINNSTISGNTGSAGAGGMSIIAGSIVNMSNTILANNVDSSSTSEDCSGIINSLDYNLIEVTTGCTINGTTAHNLTGVDPVLDALADNGGSTQTLALGAGSPAVDAGDDTSCEDTDQRGVARTQGIHCDMGAYESDANVDVTIGGQPKGHYVLSANGELRVNYAGLDSGPIKVTSTDNTPLVASLRDLWWNGSAYTSSIQLMGLPESQLSDTYVFPSYNNVTLNDQIRFGNVGNAPTTVTVTIGGQLMGTYNLQPNERQKVNYAGVDNGPVVVHSSNSVPIIASIRDAWIVNGTTTSFSQLMGLPSELLSDTYVFPSYNNVSLSDQLRFGNVGNVPTTVTVTIGGQLMGTYNLQPNERQKVSYNGLDSGPVIIHSSGGVKIIASLRESWINNGVTSSYFQMMGLPQSHLSDKYVFPSYDNVSLSGQLRFGNVGNATTMVTVTIGGVVKGTYELQPNQRQKVSYPGLDDGPVVIQSSNGVPIIASLRDAWSVNGTTKSFSQLMGLSGGQISTVYVFPSYNNVTYDNQLRVGAP